MQRINMLALLLAIVALSTGTGHAQIYRTLARGANQVPKPVGVRLY